MVIGAVINAASIIAGSGVGLAVKGKVSDKFSEGVMRALGLVICVIGLQGGLGGDIMLLVVSLAIGTFLGELAQIDGHLNSFGLWVQEKLKKPGESSTFAQGFVTSSLLYCVGAMAIVGSIDSGLRGDQSIIITKSIIDGIASIFLASTLGVGVLFSAFVVLVYQGAIELFASSLQDVFTEGMITQISAVGGIMILGLGANMALGAKIKVANLLPAFIVAVLYYSFVM